ncbi:DUF1851 domain-containing protein [Pseudomonas syringae pv. pisi str. PP1]|uniref:GAD-like domain-containing protein n=1 Tax=Pseudomonas syringae TaxID=317 RepID=UPI0004117F20|nr:GAD-like domain-containing protein [Pseudomonas syringae]AZG86987.1 DUF1851 domain-containing protein [Pseudomonas syringae pv. pisi str. PP1]UZS60591.1 GAD-like domain-containing protein [Pseudomonas syringae]
MRDESFEIFVEAMGEPVKVRSALESVIEKYKGVLPDVLLDYWRSEGWCGYADGLFWTVNPDDYKHLLDMWLSGTKFSSIDNYHVIARSAFGDLYAWGEKYGRKIVVSCPGNYIVSLADEADVPCDDPDQAIQSFFAMSDPEDYDMEDSDGMPLFERAVQKLGRLSDDEMYGFQPALVLGGSATLQNLVKLDLEVHLTILHQLSR